MESQSNLGASFKMSNLKTCVAIVLIGDPKQLASTVISGADLNEFYDYVRQSLIQRLTDAKFPVVDLTTQFRMHPRLAEFPSKHTYNRKPKIHPSTKSSVTLNYMSAAIRKWLSIADKVALISVIGVNVYDNAGLADETKSRYNVENFKAVIELIIILIRNKVSRHHAR